MLLLNKKYRKQLLQEVGGLNLYDIKLSLDEEPLLILATTLSDEEIEELATQWIMGEQTFVEFLQKKGFFAVELFIENLYI